MYKSVYLKRGKEDSLKRFHPWIFSGAINSMDENIEDGDIVRVLPMTTHSLQPVFPDRVNSREGAFFLRHRD